MAFEQGIGFVPYGGIGLQAYKTIHESESKEPIVKAMSIKILAKDPDPRTGSALVAATTDKSSLVWAAAFDTLARRGFGTVAGHPGGNNDEKDVVKLAAAAAVIHLATVKNARAGTRRTTKLTQWHRPLWSAEPFTTVELSNECASANAFPDSASFARQSGT